MKAWCHINEFNIDLTKEEIDKLKEGAISGKVKYSDSNYKRIRKDLSLIIDTTRRLDTRDLRYLLRVETDPDDANFETAFGYNVKVSLEAYRVLKENGSVGDRFGIGGKVVIKKA